MKYEARPYQAAATKFLKERSGAALFLDMGMGKTVVTLTAIKELELKNVLIIAPKSVALHVWPEEIKKWRHLKGLTFAVAIGSPSKREAAYRAGADITIVNRENVRSCVEYWCGLYFQKKHEWPYKTLIIDELSGFKGHTCLRFRALRRVRPLIERVWGLTGTPAANGYLDLWAQMYLIDQGAKLGKSILGYKNACFRPVGPIIHGSYRKWALKDGFDKTIHRLLKDTCMRLDSAGLVELPDILYTNHYVPLPQKAENAYRELEKNALLSAEAGVCLGKTAATLTTKLLQACGGAVYTEEKSEAILHTAKIEKLLELIEEANGHPVLVFYAYEHEQKRILSAYQKHFRLTQEEMNEKVGNAPDAVTRWNAGKLDLLLAHPLSAGHGLNLQAGGHIIIWYTPTWSLEQYQQANKRLHRPGQRHTCLVHHILTEKGIDRRIVEQVLPGKNNVQDGLLKALLDAENAPKQGRKTEERT